MYFLETFHCCILHETDFHLGNSRISLLCYALVLKHLKIFNFLFVPNGKSIFLGVSKSKRIPAGVHTGYPETTSVNDNNKCS